MKVAIIFYCIVLIPYLSNCSSIRDEFEQRGEDLGNELSEHYRRKDELHPANRNPWSSDRRPSMFDDLQQGHQEPELTATNRDDPDRITFILLPGPWSKKNEVIVEYNNTESVMDAPFQTKKSKFVFLVHGYIQNSKSNFPVNVAEAYNTRMKEHSGEFYNVIIVDWGALSGNARDETPSYFRAVDNIPTTARRVADFIKCLMNLQKIKSLDDVHLIGLSLGAHLVGQVGDILKKEVGEVGRVTGLDPALPLFSDLNIYPTKKLTKTDGKFVDVYHTGGGVFGKAARMGHVDFYPNGGTWWHGWTEECDDWTKFSWNHGGPAFCSHNLSARLYAYSILKTDIKASKCAAYAIYKLGFCAWAPSAVFGEFTDAKHIEDGKYYVDIELPKEE